MASTRQGVETFLNNSPATALIEVAEAKGSTPREKGAWMLVSPTETFGTIGGGQLEFMAIARAREAIGDFSPSKAREHLLDIPLGPEIGQCCGGRVELGIRHVDAALRDELMAAVTVEDAKHPHVYLFGGGHVGHALAAALSLLPLKVAVVETRADALEGMPEAVEARLTPVPEEAVRTAPPGSAFVVLTHDHALDFLIVAEALKRPDAAYVGMIGSKTKKATFKSWFLKTAGGMEGEFARLISPIGGEAVKDKRPAVIAALAAAEIMTALARNGPAY
ncbi:MAG: xanthine dehydrogenase accessory protein XdhC [Rhizobiaceae bacterium]|jgi:xanthine dehydrogenase accessory factor|nr:MAG: xanthine dehydrogenase accessory protein XdhC [Rhizobiaceae bacterium]